MNYKDQKGISKSRDNSKDVKSKSKINLNITNPHLKEKVSNKYSSSYLNQSQTDIQQPLPSARYKAVVSDDEADGEMEKEEPNASGPINFYEVWNPVAFNQQLQHSGMQKELIASFSNLHTKMITENNTLKVTNESLAQEKYKLEGQLIKRDTELEIAKARLDTCQEELVHVQCEVERIKTTDSEFLEEAAENTRELSKYQTKFYASEEKCQSATEDSERLYAENTKLKVEILTANEKIRNLKASMDLLGDNIKIKDEHLSEKIVAYDKMFERAEANTNKIQELAEKTSGVYDSLQAEQAVHLREFGKVVEVVNDLNGKVTGVGKKMDAIRKNELQSIDNSLSSMQKTIEEDLGVELRESHSKRKELNENHKVMKETLGEMHGNFKSYYSRITSTVRNINKEEDGKTTSNIVVHLLIGAFYIIITYFFNLRNNSHYSRY